MMNPYFLNIVGLVFEVLGVICLVSNAVIETSSKKTFNKFIDLAEKAGLEIDQFSVIEKPSLKIGILFIVVGLCFQIYANYTQARF